MNRIDGDPPGRRRALAVLALAMVLSMATWFSAAAVLPQLRRDWHLSTASASWLTIAVQVGFVVGAVLCAGLNVADLVSPSRLIFAGSVGAAFANLGLLLAHSVGPALCFRFLSGAFLALVYPPALKAAATWFQRKRGMALGVMVAALTVGSALPHLVNGFGGTGWHSVIVATSALTLIGGITARWGFREGPFPFPRTPFDPRQIAKVVQNRGVRWASLGYFGHMWELYAMWTWFSAFFAESLRLHGHATASRAASIVTFAVIAVGAAGCLAAGELSDRWGRTTTTIGAMLASGTCALIIGPLRAAPLWIVVVIGLVWGITVVADSAQFSAMVTELGDQNTVGSALTLQLAVGFTLTVATIWLVPFVRDGPGWGSAFGILAAGPAVGVAAMFRLRRLPEAALLAQGRR